ncbi:hypothetical protein F4821DRAFT_257559 [Hypoxylon rubiginosum]|uniref:Uncharacterized protein n=1 Tax=Hypoxylon rubiginosum TaxID=110542 RepID=A0ACC0D8M1_9PEZI|nr:hypothetical protein F4821DRAFT_257559 [Hypoxylon rubiginosum]
MLHTPKSERYTKEEPYSLVEEASDSMLHPTKSEEDTDEESYPLVEGTSGRSQMSSRHPSQRFNIWMLATFMLAFVLLAIGIRDYVQSRQQHLSREYGYETGFETDWSLAREAIRTKKVKFYGGIFFDDNEERYITTNPDEPAYVGPPTEEIDDAWYALIHNDSIAVTPEEAKEVSDRTAYDKFRGHYTVGLSVLHSLHCLNALRITLDIEHYKAKGYPEEWWSRFHIEHCINHLRQVVQCHGDVTPYPLVPASKKESKQGWITPDFDTVHTCRDFTAIREWSAAKHLSGLEKAKAASQKGE